jgi:hypothetical protein
MRLEDPVRPVIPADAAGELRVTSEKEGIETERLRHELEELRRQSRRPWLIQVAVPAIVASLASGLGSYLFRDSIADRAEAELRRDVANKYLAVDNTEAGKREQILDFIDATLARSDPELANWSRKERTHVVAVTKRIRSRTTALADKIDKVEAKIRAKVSERRSKAIDREIDDLCDELDDLLERQEALESNSVRLDGKPTLARLPDCR